jgi:hypothetical protein
MIYNDSDSDSDSSDDYYFAPDAKSDDFTCHNLDPALAKIMGIIIDEQTVKTDWKPPSHSGLSNSREIIQMPNYNNRINTTFAEIKCDIRNFIKLSQAQLEYIQNTNNDEKCEIIRIYNDIMFEKK